MAENSSPPSVCPNCGEDVPSHASACPGCGSDWDTGWKDLGGGFGGDDPEDAFDYDAAFEKEFGGSSRPLRAEGMKSLWWITGVAVVVLFLFGALRALF